jgi:NTE family protein
MEMMEVRDRLRLHMIEVSAEMKQLDASSKLIAEWAFLTYLRDLGRASAEAWLQAHNHQLGVESSFDISYLTPENVERFKI